MSARRSLTVAIFALLSSLLFGCGSGDDGYYYEDDVDYAVLKIENRSDSNLTEFLFSNCGREEWTRVIMNGGETHPGSDTAVEVQPGCYDIYLEDEYGCYILEPGEASLAAGIMLTLTVTGFNCI